MTLDIPERARRLVADHDHCTISYSGYESIDGEPGIFGRPGADLHAPKVRVSGDRSGIWIGANSHAHLDAEVIGKNSGILIGDNCRMRRLVVRIKGDNCYVILGAGSTSEHVTIIVSPREQSVIFGDDCMISSSVVLRTNDGHGVFDRNTRERLGAPASIVVGPHVWLGNGSRINKGAQIGAGTIIGQASIAGGKIDAHSSYGGIPARKIRKEIAWSRTASFDDIPLEFLGPAAAAPEFEEPRRGIRQLLGSFAVSRQRP
ncbi:hypothetical protein PY310_11225 [Pseudarthrobacter sp. H3Y2-7]|uniref:acyltransferase n=1 Tax=Pseudarthrobacter naphthalenicus TaxID=3031328 RepID=UPI0023B1E2DA|nr:hypothetical protein [Pseudarthrobacter sp. H3Y2-7]MDE8669149.1 hypothetical protein [Pseudarthrobacter sp. H3Y2-7]